MKKLLEFFKRKTKKVIKRTFSYNQEQDFLALEKALELQFIYQ